jgi:hypothetical protein
MSTPFGRRPLLDELLADSDAALAAVRLSIVALAFLLSICFSNLVGLLLVVGVVVDAIHDNPNLEWDNGYLSNVLPTLLPAPAPWPPVKTFASRNDRGTTSKLWLGAKLGKQDSTYEPIQLETAHAVKERERAYSMPARRSSPFFTSSKAPITTNGSSLAIVEARPEVQPASGAGQEEDWDDEWGDDWDDEWGDEGGWNGEIFDGMRDHATFENSPAAASSDSAKLLHVPSPNKSALLGIEQRTRHRSEQTYRKRLEREETTLLRAAAAYPAIAPPRAAGDDRLAQELRALDAAAEVERMRVLEEDRRKAEEEMEAAQGRFKLYELAVAKADAQAQADAKVQAEAAKVQNAAHTLTIHSML